jgi:hypothetical protein
VTFRVFGDRNAERHLFPDGTVLFALNGAVSRSENPLKVWDATPLPGDIAPEGQAERGR